jgi:osmotically-inducible protein OsmY
MATIDAHFDTLLGSTLRNCPHLCRRDLHVESDQGRVVLRGVVNSYYQKQMAQEILRRVEGVDRIENQLEVNWI